MSDRKLVGPSPIKIGLNNNNFTLCFMSCSEGGDITGEAILLPGNESFPCCIIWFISYKYINYIINIIW